MVEEKIVTGCGCLILLGIAIAVIAGYGIMGYLILAVIHFLQAHS